MSHRPSAVELMPLLESEVWSLISTAEFADIYASASFSMTGETEEEPATFTVPLGFVETKGPVEPLET